MPRGGLNSESVVSAAAALADSEGLEAVTLTRLAAMLGIRPPSLYAHVDGLEDLRRRLGARGSAELAATLANAAAGRAEFDALRAIADAYRAYAQANPGSYEAAQRAPDPRDATGAAAKQPVDLLRRVLRGYALEGDDALHAIRIVRATLHGFVTLERNGGFGLPLSLDDTFDRLVAAVHAGLRASAL
jgi:AcrR family transcriptional regulator